MRHVDQRAPSSRRCERLRASSPSDLCPLLSIARSPLKRSSRRLFSPSAGSRIRCFSPKAGPVNYGKTVSSTRLHPATTQWLTRPYPRTRRAHRPSPSSSARRRSSSCRPPRHRPRARPTLLKSLQARGRRRRRAAIHQDTWPPRASTRRRPPRSSRLPSASDLSRWRRPRMLSRSPPPNQG